MRSIFLRHHLSVSRKKNMKICWLIKIFEFWKPGFWSAMPFGHENNFLLRVGDTIWLYLLRKILKICWLIKIFENGFLVCHAIWSWEESPTKSGRHHLVVSLKKNSEDLLVDNYFLKHGFWLAGSKLPANQKPCFENHCSYTWKYSHMARKLFSCYAIYMYFSFGTSGLDLQKKIH